MWTKPRIEKSREGTRKQPENSRCLGRVSRIWRRIQKDAKETFVLDNFGEESTLVNSLQQRLKS